VPTALLCPTRSKQVILADTQQGFVHMCGADHLTGHVKFDEFIEIAQGSTFPLTTS
jgi:hypothetical protein